jgi:formiminoglutamase
MKNIPFERPFPTRPGDNAIDPIRLPLLVSVPHGGYGIPRDMVPRLALTFPDIFADGDPCTRSIYSFGDFVCAYHDSDIARAIIDLNRADDDLPPRNVDGVIKSHTVLGKAVYLPGKEPDRRLIDDLLQRFYYPYHRKIAQDMATDPSLICGLDCHSMLEFPPGRGNSAEKERPFICLSNGGDENGYGKNDEIFCPPDLINLLADCLRSQFPAEAESITLNDPFSGGHISQMHGRQIPWIQVELNRRAYLSRPWFDPDTLRVERYRLECLRYKIFRAIISFCEEAGNTRYLQNHQDLQRPLGHSAPLF